MTKIIFFKVGFFNGLLEWDLRFDVKVFASIQLLFVGCDFDATFGYSVKDGVDDKIKPSANCSAGFGVGAKAGITGSVPLSLNAKIV